MSNIQFQLTSDNSQFLQGIAQADNAQKALSKGAKQFGDDSKKAYNEAGKGAEGFGNETKKTEEKTKSLKAQVRELKAELANATDPKEVEKLAKAVGKLEDQIGDASDAAAVFATDSPFEAVGNAIGSVSGKLRNLDFKGAADQSRLLVAATKQITFKEGLAGIKDLGTTLVNIGKSLLLNPIFLIGATVALIVTNFDKLKNAGGLVGDTFKSIGKAVELVLDLGKDFLTFVKLIDSTKKSLDDIIKSNEAVMANINARYDLEIVKAKEAGKNVDAIEKAKAIAAVLNQKYLLSATREKYRVGEIDAKEFAERLLKIGQDSNKAVLDLENLKLAQAQKAKEKQQKANDDYKKNQEAFNAALLDLFKKAQQAELDGLSGQAKIEMQKKIAEQELQQLKDTVIKKQIEAGKGNKLSEKQLSEFNQLQLQINRKYNQDTLALEIQTITDKAALRLKDLQNSKSTLTEKQKLFDLDTQIQIEQVNALRKPKGQTDADFEMQKQIAVLEIKKKAAQDSLNLRLAEVEAETAILIQQTQNEIAILNAKGDDASKAEANRLDQSLGNIELNGIKQKELITAQTENLGKDLTQQIEKLNRDLTSFHINWADIFGVSEEEWSVIESNFSKLTSESKKAINSFLDFQDATLKKELDVIAERKKANESAINTLESQLQKQKDLKEAGYANSYDVLQRELEDKRANQAQQLEDEQKLKKEQEKIAKDRMLLQQAQQYSSLVTAIAEVYASVASSGPIGIAIGAVTIAAMLASFAYAQGQASAAINKADSSFAKGGYTGDGDKYEEAGTVHKGEFVNTKETTKKYRTLLEGMHTEDNAKIELGIAELLKGTGVSLPNFSREINISKMKLKDAEIKAYYSNDSKNLEGKVDEIVGHIKSLINKESMTVLPNGDKMIKKGSLTRIIKSNG